MPMLLIGGAIIAVVAALIFWPTSETPTAEPAKRAKAQAGASVAAGPGPAVGGTPAGGVQPRAVDEPTRPAVQPKLNPAIQLPEGGAAPAMPEPEVVPDFDDVEEEIAYYEKKLALATEALERRQKNAEYMETAVRQRVEQSPHAEQEAEVYESRKKIVDDNLATAQRKVEELEAKLEELRR
jgi:hypothetical protein